MKFISKKYSNKIFLIIFSIFFTLNALINIYHYYDRKSYLNTLLETQAKSISNAIGIILQNNKKTLNNNFLFDLKENYLLNNSLLNTIILSSKKKYLVLDKNSLELFETKQLPIYYKGNHGQFTIIENKDYYSYTQTLKGNNLHYTSITLLMNLDNYKNELQKLFEQSILLLFIITLVTGISSFLIAIVYTEPISTLNAIAKKVSQDDFDHEINLRRDDEIGELAKTFNIMIKNIASSKEKLLHINRLLEQKIYLRTKELSELNKSLDIRVQEEIAKRKEQEEILLVQSRFATMGEMISMIAHQWRQPLTTVNILVQNLELEHLSQNKDNTYFEKTVEKTLDIIKQMSNTIEDFKNFLLPNKTTTSFDLCSIVSNSYFLIEDSFKNHDINVKIEKSDITIQSLQSELSQVIINILNNAKDALIEKNIQNPTISIKFYEDNFIYQIIIEDNAGGIEKSIKDKIFEPYFSTKDKKHGIGLGLYMSKIIMEQKLNGKLYFENTQEGAKFFISINKS